MNNIYDLIENGYTIEYHNNECILEKRDTIKAGGGWEDDIVERRIVSIGKNDFNSGYITIQQGTNYIHMQINELEAIIQLWRDKEQRDAENRYYAEGLSRFD